MILRYSLSHRLSEIEALGWWFGLSKLGMGLNDQLCSFNITGSTFNMNRHILLFLLLVQEIEIRTVYIRVFNWGTLRALKAFREGPNITVNQMYHIYSFS